MIRSRAERRVAKVAGEMDAFYRAKLDELEGMLVAAGANRKLRLVIQAQLVQLEKSRARMGEVILSSDL